MELMFIMMADLLVCNITDCKYGSFICVIPGRMHQAAV